jgi:hypothetical protein
MKWTKVDIENRETWPPRWTLVRGDSHSGTFITAPRDPDDDHRVAWNDHILEPESHDGEWCLRDGDWWHPLPDPPDAKGDE